MRIDIMTEKKDKRTKAQLLEQVNQLITQLTTETKYSTNLRERFETIGDQNVENKKLIESQQRAIKLLKDAVNDLINALDSLSKV